MCTGGSVQNLKTHEVLAHINFPVPDWRFLGDFNQASISASSTGRYQIDKRDVNECRLDSIMVDESISALQIDLYFPPLFCSILSNIITMVIVAAIYT